MLYFLVDCRGEKKKLPNKHDIIYYELKTIIMDHQAVMKSVFKNILLKKKRFTIKETGVHTFCLSNPH